MTNDVLTAERATEEYLRRLRFALAPLPPEDRDEIAREIRSHFLDRLRSAPDPAGAFRATAAALGAPEDYARSFLDDYRIAAAVADGSGFAMLHQALRMAGRGVRALAGFTFFLVLFAVAVGLVLVAVLKPVFPQNVGAWYAPEAGIVGIGLVDAATAARAPDLLGYWIVPLNIALGVLLYRVGTALLRPFLRSFQSASAPRSHLA